jgi:hypothetical protein
MIYLMKFQQKNYARCFSKWHETDVLQKAVPLHATKAQGERMYSSYSFSTSLLDGGEWSASRPGSTLAPGKEPPVPIVQGAGWASELVCLQGLEEKSSASVGDRTTLARSSNLEPNTILTELVQLLCVAIVYSDTPRPLSSF